MRGGAGSNGGGGAFMIAAAGGVNLMDGGAPGSGNDALVMLGDGMGDFLGTCTVNGVGCSAADTSVFPDGLPGLDTYGDWTSMSTSDFFISGGAGGGGEGGDGEFLAPEPRTLWLLGTGLFALVVMCRRRRTAEAHQKASAWRC
jgi:hypothetical protein